jgi:hypothetical protein
MLETYYKKGGNKIVVHRVDRTKALLEWGPYLGGQASGPHRDLLLMPRVETS